MTKTEVISLLKENTNKRGIVNWNKDDANTGGLKSFGIGLTQLRKLAKQIGRDHELALKLWKSDNYDVKVTSLLIGEPKKLTKEQAEERGLKVTTGKIPMTINARYVAEHPGERGLCKVVVEEGTRRLLGVHMIGGACSEMIFGAAAMLETELREEEIDEIIFPHPTTSEVMKDVFMAVR